MGYCVARISKITTKGHMNNTYRHNYREKEVRNADPEQEYKNEELVHLNGKTYEEAFKERVESLGYGIDKTIRKNAVLAYEVVLAFSREDMGKFDLEAWKKDNVEWLRETFNLAPEKYGDNVLSVVYHEDEQGSVHCHAFVTPIDERGRLNASRYTGSPTQLAILQDSYAKKMKVHNLQRGIEGSVADHKDIKRFYTELNEATSYNLPEYTKDDTKESYFVKLDDMIKNIKAAHLREMQKKDREITEAKSIPFAEATRYKREIARLLKEVQDLSKKMEKNAKEIEGLEHEFGPIKEIKTKLKTLQYLADGLKAEPDVDKANYIAEEMNRIVSEQRRLRKKEQEKEAKRVKTMFEKIEKAK